MLREAFLECCIARWFMDRHSSMWIWNLLSWEFMVFVVESGFSSFRNWKRKPLSTEELEKDLLVILQCLHLHSVWVLRNESIIQVYPERLQFFETQLKHHIIAKVIVNQAITKSSKSFWKHIANKKLSSSWISKAKRFTSLISINGSSPRSISSI